MSDNANKPKPSYGEMRVKIEPDDVEGKPALLEIEAATLRDLAPKGSKASDWKVVLWFVAFPQKEYVVNSTSYKTLCQKLGDDYESWAGKQCVMAPTTTEYQGKQFEKLHVAIPERWDKVVAEVAKAAAKRGAK